MIASQQRHMLWVAGFEQHEKRETFKAIISTIHIVTHEDVVGVWHLASLVEQLQQIVELSMYVTTHGHRRRHRLHIRLLYQDFFHIFAELLQLALLEVLCLSPLLDPSI